MSVLVRQAVVEGAPRQARRGWRPAREDVLQADYAAWRREWRIGFEARLAADRPDGFIVGGQRDGCARPGACRADGPDLCRDCAAMLATAGEGLAA